MKNNYFIIDSEISKEENMKRLVEEIFQKELSFDILRGTPPNYDSLHINGIHFGFTSANWVGLHDRRLKNKMGYLELSFYLHKNKYGRKRKSIKIVEGTINTKYLRKIFEEFKSLREADESVYLVIQERNKKIKERVAKLRERNNIEYPEVTLQPKLNKFVLSFESVNEDEIEQLMACWNKIKKL